MRNTKEKIEQVYNFTVEYINDNGFPPSVREICAKLNIKSTATAYSYLERLKEQGLLCKSPQKKRAMTLSITQPKFKSVPLIGTIRAGAPIFAVENLEGYYPLPEEFNTGGEEFALKVAGDSMIDAGIFENDVIIVKKQNHALNGEIVVAFVEDGATVKRFYNKNNTIILQPEIPNYDDMLFDNVLILGVVKGLIRKF